MALGLIVPQTRLRVVGQTSWQVGDVELQAGNGLTGSQSAKKLKLDAANFDALSPSGIFQPGVLAATTDVAILRQVSASQTSYLRLLECNLKTGATAADATNNLMVRVRGESSGTKDLELNGTGRHFAWSATDAVVLGQLASGGSNNPASIGRRARYKATGTLNVASLTFVTREAAQATNGLTFVGYIWDATGTTVLGQTVGFSGPVSNPDETLSTPHALLNPVTIPAGTEVMIGIVSTGATPVAYEFGAGYSGQLAAATTNKVEDWNGSAWVDVSGSKSPIGVLLGGTTPGIQMTGDLHVDLVNKGTGGTPGADLNIRFIFGVSAT